MNLDFLSGIGDAIAAFFDSPLVQLGLQAIGVYIVDHLARLGLLGLPRHAGAGPRTRSCRTSPRRSWSGSRPVFFLFGILVYRIIRPQERWARPTSAGSPRRP